MHNAYMGKSAAITIRVPDALKRRLEERARREHRSLSAQVLCDLESAARAPAASDSKGRFLGLFDGGKVPTDEEIAEVRALLWGRLADRGGSRD